METSPRYFSRLRLLVCACACLVLSLTTHSQQPPVQTRYIPPELQASDQEIRKLLTSAESKADAGEYESAFADSKAALELAERKGLLGDRAIAEESVASGYFARGKVDESLRLYQACLQDAIDSSNPVLQADVLVALSSFQQSQGNLQGAIDLVTTALDRATRSKSLFIKARVLGELGKLQVISGQIEGGRKSVEQALAIDKANDYRFEPLHLVYGSYVILAQPKPDFPQAITQLESARDLALQKDNYIAFALAQNALGAIYSQTGEPQKGVATLEAFRNGILLKNNVTVQLPIAFRAAATLPFLKAVLLEGLAQAYESVQEPDKALDVWHELYSLSKDLGLKTIEAEAAHKMAEIYKGQKAVSDALSYYAIAAQDSRIVQNYQQLSQNLTSEALLLIQAGRGEEAVPLETEVADIAEKTQNRVALFTANGVLAEIYQPLAARGESQLFICL